MDNAIIGNAEKTNRENKEEKGMFILVCGNPQIMEFHFCIEVGILSWAGRAWSKTGQKPETTPPLMGRGVCSIGSADEHPPSGRAPRQREPSSQIPIRL